MPKPERKLLELGEDEFNPWRVAKGYGGSLALRREMEALGMTFKEGRIPPEVSDESDEVGVKGTRGRMTSALKGDEGPHALTNAAE